VVWACFRFRELSQRPFLFVEVQKSKESTCLTNQGAIPKADADAAEQHVDPWILRRDVPDHLKSDLPSRFQIPNFRRGTRVLDEPVAPCLL